MAKKINKKKMRKTTTSKTKKTVAAKSKKSASTRLKAKGNSIKTKSTAAKSKSPAAKKTAVKKVEAKKTTAKKTTIKKAAVKKAPVKKRVAKTAPKVEVVKKVKKLKKVKGYPKGELVQFKKVILAKREEVIMQLQNLKDQMMDPSTGQYVNESSPYSLHMAEQGTDAQEREKLYLWAQRENKFLGYLEDALQRIENGTYGLCIECIDEPKYLCPTCPLIPKERLLAVPHTQMCVEVKKSQAKK